MIPNNDPRYQKLQRMKQGIREIFFNAKDLELLERRLCKFELPNTPTVFMVCRGLLSLVDEVERE